MGDSAAQQALERTAASQALGGTASQKLQGTSASETAKMAAPQAIDAVSYPKAERKK